MISLYDILTAANGQLFGEPHAHLFTDFSVDPNQVSESVLYVAFNQDQGNAQNQIELAIKNGAGGIICTQPPIVDSTGVSVLMVQDVVDALLHWTAFILGKLRVKTIAVAGSGARSTTAHAICNVLENKYNVHSGNLDSSGLLSIPFSLTNLKPEHDYVVIKLNSQRFGDMAKMAKALSPSVVVILQLDCLNVVGFESCEQYLADQASLFDNLMKNGVAVLNYDEDQIMEFVPRIKANVQTFGMERFGADWMAYNAVYGSRRIGFDLRHGGERYVGKWTPLLGKSHIFSALASLAVAKHLDVEIEDALRTLTAVNPLNGRMNAIVGLNDSLILDDSYHATVNSSLSALEWMENSRLENQRTILIFGDMDDSSQYAHRQIGTRAAEVADLIITQGAEASHTARAAIDHGMNPAYVQMTYSPQDAISALRRFGITKNDIILVKGGQSSQMEVVVHALLADEADESKLVRLVKSAKQVQLPYRPLHPSWIEIDPEQLGQNVRAIKQQLADDVTLMAVVKANGYGHGAVMVAQTAIQNGAGYLGVASIAEAIELRTAGIQIPILILSYIPLDAVRLAIQENLTVTVFDLEQARAYQRIAEQLNARLTCHVKIDTGMGRLGVMPNDTVNVFRYLASFKNLEIEGLYTHFSTADEDPEYTTKQVATFKSLILPLKAASFQFCYIHASNSAGTFLSDDLHFNLVRPGLALYGYAPGNIDLPEEIVPALAWKTSILQVKTLPAGHPVGYGNTYKTRTTERIAILPIGYADGFRRAPQTWRHVLINGQVAPLVGRVSMEKCAINVTKIENVQAGDEVTLIGKQGNEQISVDDVARWLGTINYEVITTLSNDIPRIYRKF